MVVYRLRCLRVPLGSRAPHFESPTQRCGGLRAAGCGLVGWWAQERRGRRDCHRQEMRLLLGPTQESVHRTHRSEGLPRMSAPLSAHDDSTPAFRTMDTVQTPSSSQFPVPRPSWHLLPLLLFPCIVHRTARPCSVTSCHPILRRNLEVV
jgi:hypothetical protein